MTRPMVFSFYALVILGVSSSPYFFSDYLTGLEYNKIEETFTTLHNPLNCMIVDRKMTSNSDSIMFLALNPENESLKIFNYLKKDGAVKREKIVCDLRFFIHNNSERFIKRVCIQIRRLQTNLIPEIYFWIDLDEKSSFKYQYKLDDYIKEYHHLLRLNLPDIPVIQSLPTCVCNYYDQEAEHHGKKSASDLLHLSQGRFDCYTVLNRTISMKNLLSFLVSEIKDIENQEMKSLAKKYRTLLEPLDREEDKFELRSYNNVYETHLISKENETNFFFLYILEEIRKNKKYTKDIIKANFTFFTTLLNFIISKNTFCEHFDKLYKKCEKTTKSNFINSFKKCIKKNSPFDCPFSINHLSEKNISTMLKLFFEYYLTHSTNWELDGLISSFFSFVLKNFNVVAKIVLSENSTRLDHTRENLINKSSNRLDDLLSGFVDVYNDISNLKYYSECEKELFLQLKQSCWSQFLQNLHFRKAVSPLVHQILRDLSKSDYWTEKEIQ